MIAVISGTNRPGAQTLRVAKIIEKRLRAQGAETELLSLQDLPAEIFRPDAYATKPAAFARFNDAILKAEGVYIVTPEYNGSFPGVLKLFIDMLKFPEAFEKRPVAFCGVAAGMWGALRSVEQLTQIFQYRNAFTFNERVFLARVESQLTPADGFTTPFVEDLVNAQVKGFIEFCRKLHSA